MAEDKKVKKSKKSDKSPGDESTTPKATEEGQPAEAGEPKPEAAEASAEAPAEAPAAAAEEAAPLQAPVDTPAPPAADSTTNQSNSSDSQRLEEKAQKAEAAHAAEVKVRKELEALNAKLLAEKTALLDSLSGEKGQLQDFQERCAKMQAQKNDLENQLRVSIHTKKNHKFSCPPN